jgi:hypothetical protein
VSGVEHPYFPLTPGVLRIYEGDDEGLHRMEEVRTLEQTRVIVGINCTGVMQEVFISGELVEHTTEWYAQDHAGNVWKFGEESLEPDADSRQLVATKDSWLAGVGEAEPWMAFAAAPQVGDTYLGYEADGLDEFEVLSVTDTVTVPAGTFENCLKILENPADPEDTDIILYSRGVGRVSERSSSGRIVLVSRQRR